MSLRLAASAIAPSPNNHPYENSLASSASSSTSSIFSDAPSQQSWSTLSSQSSQQNAREAAEILACLPQPPSESDGSVPCARRARAAWSASSQASYGSAQGFPNPLRQTPTWPQHVQKHLPSMQKLEAAVSADQRQHPRRCQMRDSQKPPPLVRQTERKVTFVDCLVDSATQMVEVIWPLSAMPCRSEIATGKGVLPLRTFIQETLRRSRTSYSTLQVALYYLILIKPHVPKCDFTMEQTVDLDCYRVLQCGRRMFLAALILASKYLQDRNFSARAWSKISGLKVTEINLNEMAFLAAIRWKLHLADGLFEKWTDLVIKFQPSENPGKCPEALKRRWRTAIPQLTPELDGTEQLTTNLGRQEALPPPTPIRNGFQLLTGGMQNLQLPSTPIHSTSGENTPTPTPSTVAPRLLSQPTLTPTNLPVTTPTTSLPQFLEPRSEPRPPTPCLIRQGPLPTPQLTPSSVAAGTPAAGSIGFNSAMSSVAPSAESSRRPSMCAAMQTAQNSWFVRTALDQLATSTKGFCTAIKDTHNVGSCPISATMSYASRRGSNARSSSSGSSPESVLSDNASSRFSRASSISSVSSSGLPPPFAGNGAQPPLWGPGTTGLPSNLCRMATCRNMKLPYPVGPQLQPSNGHGLRHMKSTSRLAELSEHAELMRINTSTSDPGNTSDALDNSAIYTDDLTSSPPTTTSVSPTGRRPSTTLNLTLRSKPSPSSPAADTSFSSTATVVPSEGTTPTPRRLEHVPTPTSTDARRKRPRSSAHDLQTQVRDLLARDPSPPYHAPDDAPRGSIRPVVSDDRMAESFLLPLPRGETAARRTASSAMASVVSSFGSSGPESPKCASPGPKGVQSPARSGSGKQRCGERKPVQRTGSKRGKRACCGGGLERKGSSGRGVVVS